ncbi:IclR family transcriptional regulator [Streptomyces sp. PTY087I2]|uniref:IclR family transcriptional regulator n=1 Tax=Streptomyces sp. PTY087I2 TaxID=1819298 RepID=UPI00080B7AAA|nr:IclR family transcriptional regulator C-terminal domain-containing protein [Streptomyces sp. PTY087I2]OCC07779.1 Pectin degradation repressor protein KdgR [Streptomyces sp. PTY087I2]
MSVTAEHRPRGISGIGVLDKASVLLAVVEKGPATLAELVADSGFARPTVHRIALGLEHIGLFTRDFKGRFVLGPRLGAMAAEVQRDRLVRVAPPVLAELRELTGFDARLFRRSGAMQLCVSSSVDVSGGREDLPVGMARSLKAGPVAQVLLAWEEPRELYEGLRSARFTGAQLTLVRSRGWVHGPEAIVPGAVSIAVPVRAMGKRVVAALALTGPCFRMPEAPNRVLLGALIDAAGQLGDLMAKPGSAARAWAR